MLWVSASNRLFFDLIYVGIVALIVGMSASETIYRGHFVRA